MAFIMRLFTTIICSACLMGSTVSNNEGFYNIAHMTNNIPSIDWAMEKGANSVELDLQFKEDGTPYKFFHSPSCDCTCMCPAGGCHIAYPNSVCVQLEKTSSTPCDANTDAATLLRHAASKPTMAMVVIDSKLTDGGKIMTTSTLRTAGRKIVELLEKNLFKAGFRGEVIIGSPGFDTLEYIKEISKTTSPYKNRIHFTVDMEDIADTKLRLDFSWNKNVVYNVGISTCAPTNEAYFAVSKLAAINKEKGVFGMTYTWSVDKYVTMEYYINYFNGIITNYPETLTNLLKEKGIKMATPSDVIPAATSSLIETDDSKFVCECTYYGGGCRVTKKAPRGLACQCTYPFLWTCSGWVVQCTNPESSQCENPGLAKEHCEEGRGDCGGY